MSGRLPLPYSDFDSMVQSLYLNHRMSSLQIVPVMGASKQSVLRSLERSGVARRENKDANRLYSHDEDFFSSIDSSTKAYWLGFITADGCVYYKSAGQQRTLSIALQERDKAHLVQFAVDIKTESVIRDLTSNYNKGIASLQIYSQKVTRDLERYGVVPRKSLILQPPNSALIPDDMMRHYIRGFIDGNGSIHRLDQTIVKNGRCYMSHGLGFSVLSTEPMLGFIRQRLPDSLFDRFRIRPQKAVYEMRAYFSPSSIRLAEDLYNYLYDDADRFLSRKKEKLEEYVKDYSNR